MKLYLIVIWLVLTPAFGFAQRLTVPSPHFGALSIPEPGATAQLGVSFDSFTEFGKEVDENGNFVLEPYNSLNKTVGLNFFSYSYSYPSRRWSAVYYRTTFQAGYGHDRPTKDIQDWLHDIQDLRHVPRGAVRNDELDGALAFEANLWWNQNGNLPHFLGGGLSIGTPYQEVFLQCGGHIRLEPLSLPFINVSYMGKIGSALGGLAFPKHSLEGTYASGKASLLFQSGSLARDLASRVGQTWLRYVLYIVPDASLTIHTDSGFFSGLRKEGVYIRNNETMVSAQAIFGKDVLTIETWNDLIGNKDKGPTGGGRIFVKFYRVPWRWLP